MSVNQRNESRQASNGASRSRSLTRWRQRHTIESPYRSPLLKAAQSDLSSLPLLSPLIYSADRLTGINANNNNIQLSYYITALQRPIKLWTRTEHIKNFWGLDRVAPHAAQPGWVPVGWGTRTAEHRLRCLYAPCCRKLRNHYMTAFGGYGADMRGVSVVCCQEEVFAEI
ncbi:hypothetical protein QE152_g33557 [Popillia japonica]|uniref:Uncharacterized protein n=1 Tax=Popillia japonica TaxID=7064 RepID=A0AAW1IVZ4_POPJA